MSEWVARYLDDLIKKGEERKRLTSQLQTVVSTVLDGIAETLPTGTTVDVAGVGILKVTDLYSNIGTWRTIVCKTEDMPSYVVSYVFSDSNSPGSTFFLHRDLTCELSNAPRNVWVAVANALPQIIEAFNAEADKIIMDLRGAFENLKKLAESESKA